MMSKESETKTQELPFEDDWPLSQKEIAVARQKLAASYDIVSLVGKLTSNIARYSSSNWTHKCKCPFHAGGNERTPSFFFSEKTGHFRCFSCHLHGDVFDILSKIEGSPAFVLAEQAAKEEHGLDLESSFDQSIDTDLRFEINIELSKRLFNWLFKRKGTKSYLDDFAWVERQFEKIDQRLFAASELSKQELVGFKIQIEKEIQRMP
jgi:DNA primase